jgi:paraquat-inducible protein B
MSRAANPSVIGAFVLGAVVLGVAAVMLFGSGEFFEERNPFVLYFDHSVQGLEVGSPVIFQGVEIGTVTTVSALVDFKTGVVAIPVYIEIVQGRVTVVGERAGVVGGVATEVKRGLRARLKSLSLITGKLYVDLDYYPDKPAVFKHLDPDTPEIPTIPSELQVLLKTLQALPLPELVDKLASAAESLDKLLKKPELDDAIDQLDGTLTEARGTLTKLNARVDPLADSVEATLEKARSALQAAQEAVAAVKGLVEPGSPVQYELISALEEVERAARSVRVLADGLSQQPNSIIFGKEKSGD